MNERQKIVQEAFLGNEEAVIKRLKQVYKKSLDDITKKSQELQNQINRLDALQGMTSDPEELAKLKSMVQSKVYQKQYQDALKKQVGGILDNMQVEEFKTISEYLNKCYEEGFLGTMYDLQGQGIPLCFPIDQAAMVRAVQTDSKISKGLYQRLGEDVDLLKRKITAQVSRGISTGMSFQEVAGQLAAYTNIGYNNAVRISRTEGHRIQVQSGMDACNIAKSKGADVVKQWDSSLDKRTRESHQKVDGEVRELDKPFSNGLMFPGDPSGIAAEVVNCRCALLQRARKSLTDEEFTKMNGETGELVKIKAKDYDEFKKEYWEEVRKQEIRNGWDGLGYPQNYKTKKEAVEALKNKYNISFSDSRKYPINQEILCDAVSWMDSFASKYKNFVEKNPAKVPKLVCKAPSSMKNAVGQFRYYVNGTPVEIALNGAYHSNKDAFEAYEKRCIESKWTVANATVHKTFVHEYGHYVSNSMAKFTKNSAWEHDFIEECMMDFKKAVPDYDKNSYAGLSDYLSRYGSTSESECFAEAFAEFYGGENPREFAKIFGTKLDGLLKGVE